MCVCLGGGGGGNGVIFQNMCKLRSGEPKSCTLHRNFTTDESSICPKFLYPLLLFFRYFLYLIKLFHVWIISVGIYSNKYMFQYFI